MHVFSLSWSAADASRSVIYSGDALAYFNLTMYSSAELKESANDGRSEVNSHCLVLGDVCVCRRWDIAPPNITIRGT